MAWISIGERDLRRIEVLKDRLNQMRLLVRQHSFRNCRMIFSVCVDQNTDRCIQHQPFRSSKLEAYCETLEPIIATPVGCPPTPVVLTRNSAGRIVPSGRIILSATTDIKDSSVNIETAA